MTTKENTDEKKEKILALNTKLANNINILIKDSKKNQRTLAKSTKIPYSTFNSLTVGIASSPSLYTVSETAKLFNVNISQLVGELPLSFTETILPILKWEDINTKTNSLNFNITNDTKYISCSCYTKNKLFALSVGQEVSSRYKENTIIIIEESDEFANNDIVLLSVNNASPAIKKISKEGNDVYLESLSKNVPLQEYNKEKTKIFGVIRETRIFS